MTATRDLLLCLDTSTPTARVAIVDRGGGVRFAVEATAERHSSHVLPLCAEALRAVDVAPSALAAVACGGGPGSFTGLRVGMAVAKGLALPTRVPFYVVSSLEALALDILAAGQSHAAAADAGVTAVPCLDAGKGEVHVAGFVADPAALVRETAGACRLPAADIAAWLADVPNARIAGNGAERHVVPGRVAVSGPSAASIGRLALLQVARGAAADLAGAVPLYGRPPDITVKRKGP
jgi:tRNA threonylcarbamoyladenosine biosynthesis protein TsaB